MGNLGITVEFLPRGRERERGGAHQPRPRRMRGANVARAPHALSRSAEAPRAFAFVYGSYPLSPSVRPLSLRLRRPRPPIQPTEEQIHRARVAVGRARPRRSAAVGARARLLSRLALRPAAPSLTLIPSIVSSSCLVSCAPVLCVLSCGGGAAATRPVRCPVVRCVLPSSSDGPAGAGAGRPAPASGSSCSCLLPGGARAATSSSSNPMLLLLLLL